MRKTALFDRHVAAGAQMVPFGGWEMPLQYASGIVQEHLETRKGAGLFDVSHMGRLVFRGAAALPFLQHVLTNNAALLEVGQSQYTMIPEETGGAVDDAYLYRFVADEFLLVVNAANREKDLTYFKGLLSAFPGVEMIDHSGAMGMLSLQGPRAEEILAGLLAAGNLPVPKRNALSKAEIDGIPVAIGRTGYTGEPRCFELFFPSTRAEALWDRLIQRGACPVGLGARDTLRLEAALPLYGHELGEGPGGRPIPIFACQLARFAVSMSPEKGAFIGRQVLARQAEALRAILAREPVATTDLPVRIVPLALLDKGVARAGHPILANGQPAGIVTSGTMVPYWKFAGTNPEALPGPEKGSRAIALALVDHTLREGSEVSVAIRGKSYAARIVSRHMKTDGPHVRAVIAETPDR